MTETLEKLVEMFKKSIKEDYIGNKEAIDHLNRKIKDYEEIINVIKAKKNIKKI